MSDLCVFSVGEDLSLLEESCRRVMITLQRYHYAKFEGLAHAKIDLAIDFLQSRPEKLCMFLDGHDTLLLEGEDEIFARFNAYSAEVMIATESTCWPDEEYSPLYDKHLQLHSMSAVIRNKYINSGGWIGERGALLTTLHQVRAYNKEVLLNQQDDQRAWTRAYLAGMLPHLTLDYGRRFFTSLGDGIKPEFTVSASLHWNGRTPGREEYWNTL